MTTPEPPPTPDPMAPAVPTPIAVPEELRALAAHHPVAITALRDARVAIEAAVSLDEREIELVRLAALVAAGAPPGSLTAHVRRALSVGASTGDVWDAVAVLATIVGVPRLIAAVPVISAAIDATTTQAG